MHIINELNMGKFINLKVKKYSLGMKQKKWAYSLHF